MRMYYYKFHFIAVALLLCACTENDGTVTFETITANKTVALSNDSVPPTCSVTLRLEKATKESGRAGEIINSTVIHRLLDRDDEDMQVAADAFVEDYTSNYSKTLLPLYNQDRGDIAKRVWYYYYYIINSRTQRGSKGTLVYIADINCREGGINALTQQIVMNFEEKTGRQLSYRDVFVEGFEAALKPILLKALKEYTGLTTIRELKDKGYLRSMEIYVPDNFILGDETITFIFNPDEIASETIGYTELTISYTEIENILNSSFEH